MYYPYSENKDADQMCTADTAQVIYAPLFSPVHDVGSLMRRLIYYIREIDYHIRLDADQMCTADTAQVICAFVFARARCRFAYAAAHILYSRN